MNPINTCKETHSWEPSVETKEIYTRLRELRIQIQVLPGLITRSRAKKFQLTFNILAQEWKNKEQGQDRSTSLGEETGACAMHVNLLTHKSKYPQVRERSLAHVGITRVRTKEAHMCGIAYTTWAEEVRARCRPHAHLTHALGVHTHGGSHARMKE